MPHGIGDPVYPPISGLSRSITASFLSQVVRLFRIFSRHPPPAVFPPIYMLQPDAPLLRISVHEWAVSQNEHWRGDLIWKLTQYTFKSAWNNTVGMEFAQRGTLARTNLWKWLPFNKFCLSFFFNPYDQGLKVIVYFMVYLLFLQCNKLCPCLYYKNEMQLFWSHIGMLNLF